MCVCRPAAEAQRDAGVRERLYHYIKTFCSNGVKNRYVDNLKAKNRILEQQLAAYSARNG